MKMTIIPDDPNSIYHAALKVLAAKTESLLPQKWMDLHSARLHVLEHLVAHCVETGRTEGVDLKDLIDAAERHASGFLIRAFSTGELATRGIDYSAISSPVLLEPLPSIWWHRAIDTKDAFAVYNDGLPIHLVSWPTGQIVRCQEHQRQERLAIATNIEVDQPSLIKLVKPVADDNPAAALVRSRAGRKPDEARIAAVQKIAKDAVKEKFGSLASFANEIASRFGNENSDGIDAKQIGRWLFGDK